MPEHLETLAAPRPHDARGRALRARLPLPPRDHARGRLRPADRRARAASCTARWPSGTSAPTARTSWRRTTRCSPITGRAPTIPTRPSTYLERAGRQALRSGAFREALHLPRRRRARGRGRPRRTRSATPCARRASAPRTTSSGDFDRSRECLERARRASSTRRSRSTRLGVARGAGARGRHAGGAPDPPGALSAGAARPATALIAEALGCYKILGQIGYLGGRADARRSLYGTLAGLNLGEEAGPSPDLARMLIHAATASSIVGLQTQADRYAGAGHRDGRRGRAARGERLRVERPGRDRTPTAATGLAPRRRTRRALERLGEVGDFNLEAEVWQMRSAIYICSGAFGSAESAWSRHRELAERKRQPAEPVLVAARRGGDAAWAATRSTPRPRRSTPRSPSPPRPTTAAARSRSTTRPRWSARRRGAGDEAIAAADAIMEIIERQPPSAFHYVDFCAGAVGVYFDALEDGAATVPRRCAGRSAAARSCAAPRASSATCARGAGCWRACSSGSRATAPRRASAGGAPRRSPLSKGTPLRARPGAATRSPATATPAPASARPTWPSGGDVRATRRAADAPARARGAGPGSRGA